MAENEGKVKDLIEKLNQGEMTSKEALQELRKRKLVESEKWEIVIWILYIALWLPFNILYREQLPSIRIPLWIIFISIILSGLGMAIGIWATRMHYKSGGLKDDQTVVLIKEGPYSVVRHPAMGVMFLFFFLPIIFSEFVPFTLLSVAAIIVLIVYTYLGVILEEKKLNIPKWGDDYRKYMKEVPRFNFITGYIKLKKRKKGNFVDD
jgi:protein-S-isoprenylcysteine O-methyltransferase Ste14